MTRQNDDREKFLEILATTPFINHACKKVGISRATIYRWMKDNERFRRKMLKALDSGRDNFVEQAETVLISKVRKGDLSATKFFLVHNSNRYRARMPKGESKSVNKTKRPPLFDEEDETVVMTKRGADLLDDYRKEAQSRKNRAMGFPGQDPKGPIG